MEGILLRKHKLLHSAQLYMQENLAYFSVGELCAYLNVEERTLCNIFVQNMKVLHKKYLDLLRLERSKHYPETTSLSILVSAAELGFSNPDHFSTTFPREYGVTPKLYQMTFSLNPEEKKHDDFSCRMPNS